MSEQEFESIYKSEFNRLFRVALSVIKEENEANDIVQQVFLKLWNAKDNLSIQTTIGAYLHRSVINTALNQIEKNKRLRLQDDLSPLPLSEQDENKIDEVELREYIKAAVTSLPAKCQTVFSLSRYAGLTNKEIAEELDISVKAVEKHIGNALKQLRVKLKPSYSKLLQLVIFYALISTLSWSADFLNKTNYYS